MRGALWVFNGKRGEKT